jgi:hypothetical protein
MRCPKCGFISFDHLTSCAKCRKDIVEVATELQGTSIKVETPMFLSGALASYADTEESFEEHAMEAEVDDEIDFSMEDEAVEEEAVEMAEAEEDVDFSFEEEEEEADVSLAEAEAEEAAGIEEEAVDFAIEDEVEEDVEEAAEPEAADKSFEELDFMGPVDDEEEGGLEFDLEDFLEDDDDKSKTSGSDDVDLDLDEEK